MERADVEHRHGKVPPEAVQLAALQRVERVEYEARGGLHGSHGAGEKLAHQATVILADDWQVAHSVRRQIHHRHVTLRLCIHGQARRTLIQ